MIIIGGTGGSGTRLITEFCIKSGFYMGKGIKKNGSDKHKDAWPFNLLLNKWSYEYINGDADESLMLEKLQVAMDIHLKDNKDNLPWGFKNPRNIFLFPFYHKYLPDAKIIQVVRDGRDMMFSNNKRTVKEYGKLYSKHKRERDVAIKMWNDVNMAAYNYCTENMPDRYMFVRYEDICKKNKKVCRDLFEFINAPKNKMPNIDKLVNKAKIGKWKSRPATEIKRAERLGTEALKTFGYIK